MWIALQQADWNLDSAAVKLGDIWSEDPLWTRVTLGQWLDELLADGLVEEV
jgi:hypothetical protein